jgi:hypothetical protein
MVVSLDLSLYSTITDLRSQGITSEHTTLQAIERYEPNTQAVILLADDVRVTSTHVLDSGGQANCIEEMKKQLGFAEREALWRAHLDKKGSESRRRRGRSIAFFKNLDAAGGTLIRLPDLENCYHCRGIAECWR